MRHRDEFSRDQFGMPCYEADPMTEEQLIARAMGGDWPALALDALVINSEIDFATADEAYRKVFGFGLDAGVIADKQDQREIAELRVLNYAIGTVLGRAA